MRRQRNKRKRAGIIPYSYNQEGQLVFLIGVEFAGHWDGFIGGIEDGEKVEDSAIREFIEESMGFFNSTDTAKVISSAIKCELEGHYSISTYYFLKIDYNDKLPFYFQNVLQSILLKSNTRNKYGSPLFLDAPEGYFEKSAVLWCTKDDLVENKAKFNRDKLVDWMVSFNPCLA